MTDTPEQRRGRLAAAADRIAALRQPPAPTTQPTPTVEDHPDHPTSGLMFAAGECVVCAAERAPGDTPDDAWMPVVLDGGLADPDTAIAGYACRAGDEPCYTLASPPFSYRARDPSAMGRMQHTQARIDRGRP